MAYNIKEIDGKFSIQKENDYESVSFLPFMTSRYYEQFIIDLIYENDTLDGDIPDWVQTDMDNWLADKQLKDYTYALERLTHPILADGREEVKETITTLEQAEDSDGNPVFDSNMNPVYQQREVVTATAIDPLPATITESREDAIGTGYTVEVDNPLIIKDNEERAAAQAIIDATPQSVIDAYNS